MNPPDSPALPVSATNDPDPVRYTLRFPAPHTHYVEVEAIFPTEGRETLDLFMAVWTPGSYLIREYERHVEHVRASGPDGPDAQLLTIAKTAKNRWRVASGGLATVTVRYRVYGREMTVRNNWIESTFAMINGAPTFISVLDDARAPRPHDVRVELAAGWTTSFTALSPIAGQPHTYRAADYDELVDSPVLLGNAVSREFQVRARRHVLVLEGETRWFDADQAVSDMQRIVTETGCVMDGRADYPQYHMLNLVAEGGGGLEHTNSFLIITGRYTTRTRRAYLNWLGLAAHEFFHVWNIKRLRPIELGPFDYEREVHTRSLWIAEGFTDYYAGLIVRRAGLMSRDEYFEELSGQIEAVQTTPGRLVMSVEMASFDAWIKQYRPDENTANTTINYYPKGAVIAFLLDVRIRRATGGAKSLDDAMRLAYDRHARGPGYTVEAFYQAMSDTAGVDLRLWFSAAVETTEELDYQEALDWFGLRFRPAPTGAARAWIGAATRNDSGRLVVSGVGRGTPVFEAGINVDDEIIAIDEVRVRADGLAARLEQYRSGDTVSMVVARRERLMRVVVTLGAEPARWRLEPDPRATDTQKAHVAAWIGQ